MTTFWTNGENRAGAIGCPRLAPVMRFSKWETVLKLSTGHAWGSRMRLTASKCLPTRSTMAVSGIIGEMVGYPGSDSSSYSMHSRSPKHAVMQAEIEYGHAVFKFPSDDANNGLGDIAMRQRRTLQRMSLMVMRTSDVSRGGRSTLRSKCRAVTAIKGQRIRTCMELSSSVCAQGPRRHQLHLWGSVCDPCCAASREKNPVVPSYVPEAYQSSPFRLPPWEPRNTAFSSGAGQVVHEGVGKEAGDERGPGPTRGAHHQLRVLLRAGPGGGTGGAQGARV